MNLCYSWWHDRDQFAGPMRRRCETWIDDVLAMRPDQDLPTVVKADAMSFLGSVTLSYSGNKLSECTGGFLRNGDEDQLPFDLPEDEPDEPFACLLKSAFPQFVAAVATYYSLKSTQAAEGRLRAAAYFVETLGIPLRRVIRAAGAKNGADALDSQTLDAVLNSERLHRSLAKYAVESLPNATAALAGTPAATGFEKKSRKKKSSKEKKPFASFANALAYVTTAAKRQAIDDARQRREFSNTSKSEGKDEDSDGGPLEFADEQHQRCLVAAGWLSDDFGEWPELFDALSQVASRVAEVFPAADGPRELLQLMLGGVYHKAQNSQPWSELPWGVQPLRIKAVTVQFGPNWLRRLSSQVSQLMHEHGFLKAVIATLVNWQQNAEAAAAEEELPDMTSLVEMDDLVEHIQRRDIEKVLAGKGTGWTCFENVARQTTRQILDKSSTNL
ncbi:MAG: hypothetical protein O3C40_18805 [Planctomycetota bacterium]|nr:hypothetical protein [Planctomycetota bacterium]